MRKRYGALFSVILGLIPTASLALSCVAPDFNKRFEEHLNDSTGVVLIGAMHKKHGDAYYFFGQAFKGDVQIPSPELVKNKIIPLGPWRGDLIVEDHLRVYFATQNPQNPSDVTFESQACGSSIYRVTENILQHLKR